LSEEEGLPQLQDDAYESDEEEKNNDEGDEVENEDEENVGEAGENEDEEKDGEQPALWLRGPAGMLPLPTTHHKKWVIGTSGDK
jgi:hypothetical protein